MPIDFAFGTLLLVAAVIAAVSFFVARNEKRALFRRYQKHQFLFTEAERAFLPVLERALDGSLRVYAKVRLADLIGVRSGTSPTVRQSALNKISSKHVDFVVCDRDTVAIRGAIELDDRSHARAERRQRDDFVNELFETVGLPLIRIPVRASYSLGDIRKCIRPLLEPEAAPGQPLQSAHSVQPEEMDGGAALCCPKCGAALTRRVARRGAHAGEEFWACTAYPQCRFTRPVEVSVEVR